MNGKLLIELPSADPRAFTARVLHIGRSGEGLQTSYAFSQHPLLQIDSPGSPRCSKMEGGWKCLGLVSVIAWLWKLQERSRSFRGNQYDKGQCISLRSEKPVALGRCHASSESISKTQGPKVLEMSTSPVASHGIEKI